MHLVPSEHQSECEPQYPIYIKGKSASIRMFKSVFKTGIRGIYNVSDSASFSNDMWSVYPAKHKQTNKTVSVFIFDKSRFESQLQRLCSQSAISGSPKQLTQEYFEQIRAEISNLTKLKHPQILTVLEVLEETKLKFLFVTEPVIGNLASIDLQNENELSIQKGILEVSKGLQFLHNNCSIVHLNLQPSSIYVTTQGDWKLAGFKFLQNLGEMGPLERNNFYIMNSSLVIESANHNLNFTAPELLTDDVSQRLTTANDVWSLGLLIFYLYNRGDYLINCFETNNVSDFKAEYQKFKSKFYNHLPAELKYLLKEIPDSIWGIMTQLLARHPNDRITIGDFIDSDFFNGSLIKMMWFIDEFTTKSLEEKVVFLNGLLKNGELLEQLPNTFRNSKLLLLLIEAVKLEIQSLLSKKLDRKTDEFISKALLVIFKIGEFLSNLSFQDRIGDEILCTGKPRKGAVALKTLIKLSVKVRLAIVSNLELLLKKLQQKQTLDIMQDSASLCVTFAPNDLDLQDDQIRLQDMYLSQLSLVAELFDFPYVKNTLFPLICQVFKTTTVLSTKVRATQTFGMFMEKKVIDKVIVSEQLLPVLENLKSRDKRVIGSVLQLFARLSASTYISLELDVYVDKILSQSLRLVFGCSDCTKSEFHAFLSSVESIKQRAVDEKTKTLTDHRNIHKSGDNFDTLIENSLIKNDRTEKNIAAPVLRPSQERYSGDSSPRPPESSLSKPLTLKPQQRTTQAVNKPHFRFGQESGSPNLTLQSSQNATRDTAMRSNGQTHSSIDWSPASLPETRKANNTNSYASTSQKLTELESGRSSSPYPPGFSADILTPNSLTLPTPKTTQTSTSLIDLL